MSNGIIQAADSNTARVQAYLHVDDFSPGCYDNSYISSAEPVLSAPIGAANAEGTFCCASLPSGGLGPLPTCSAFAYSNSFPGSLTEFWITGFIVNPGLNADPPELIIIMEGDSGSEHYVLAYSYVPFGGSAHVILASNSATTPGIFGAPYPAWTRMSPTTSGSPPVAQPPFPPVLVFPGAVATDANGNAGHLYVYPPLLAPTTYAVQDLIVSNSSTTGQVICYGDRVQVLTGISYSHPGSDINTNENINYTDPPQSSTYGNQESLLASEEPWGYGAWGSVSIGELLLVKKYGGGVMLNGDIEDPNSVISLPGIQSTGDFVGSADATTQGLIYCAQDRGAWLWNGGNTSQKISAQLRDNFFDAAGPTGIPSNNYGFFVGHWQDWMLFSNNYLFNPDTGGWWVLYPNDQQGNGDVTGHTFFWYSGGTGGNQMFAAPLRIGTSTGLNRNWFYVFDNTTPAPHYQWVSLPIHVTPTADRLIDIRQVIIRVSSPDGTTTPTATISIGSWTATTDGVIGENPTTFRFNVGAGALAQEDIIIGFTGDNASGSAPILHSIDVGFNYVASKETDN